MPGVFVRKNLTDGGIFVKYVAQGGSSSANIWCYRETGLSKWYRVKDGFRKVAIPIKVVRFR
jgi:hypothetical protein